jgi:hypothetical protein
MKKMLDFEIMDTGWARDLELEYTEYINACFESIEEDEHFATLSGEPFCGCETCCSREQLCFLTPRIIKAYNDGKVVLTEESK